MSLPSSPQIKCSIIIDGSNFYHKLKSLGFQNLLDFDFAGFATFVAKGAQIISKRYYIGAITNDDKTDKGEQLLRNQQKLLSNLRKQGFSYSLGYMLKDSGGIYKEKGVDVQMAIDIVKAAYEATCEQIILISSDTDLILAIKVAKGKGIEVIYIGFKHQASYALVGNASKHRLLLSTDIIPFAK